jgi:hypothetical protein
MGEIMDKLKQARLTMLFALSNLWMVRKRLLNMERG